MKKIVVLIIFVCTGMFVAFYFQQASELETISDTKPEKFDRILADVQFKESKRVDLGKRDSVYKTGALKQKGDKYYVASQTYHKIHVYDKDWMPVKAIGKGQGKGPGEIQYLVDFDIDEKHLWALDVSQLAIHQFKLSGEFITSKFIKGHPLRVSALKDELIVTVMGSGTDSLFLKASKTSEEKHMFGKIVENQLTNFLALAGEIERFENGFIYIPEHASLVYIYDDETNLKTIIQAPDGLHFPGVEQTSTGGGVQYGAPSSAFEARSSFIEKNRLFVMLYEREGVKPDGEKDGIWNNYIDVYDMEKGEYLFSYKLDIRPQDFVLSNNELCVLDDDKVTCYNVIPN